MASLHGRVLFFFNDTATTEIFPLSLHDALPISRPDASLTSANSATAAVSCSRSRPDRKSTRLNSSHVEISYAVFCLKKKRCTAGGTASRPAERPARAGGGRALWVASGPSRSGRGPRGSSLGPPRAQSPFFFKDPPTAEIPPLPLHAALPV